MDSNKGGALQAKENAEKLFAKKDFTGAKACALKAQLLYPELEGISQMVATFEVYVASQVEINGEIDYYAVLGLEPSADKATLKKQYRKMAVLLHPDKNKSIGAEGAFKLVSEAWTLLSDTKKRNLYDLRRNQQLSSGISHTKLSSAHSSGFTGFDNCSKPSVTHTRLDTFWTVCTSCQVQYEYLQKYLNKRLSCKNCRGVFIAVETGAAPVNGSFPYCPWSYVPDNGYGNHGFNGESHGFNGAMYGPTTGIYFTGNGAAGMHSAHGGPEYVPNVPFQWNSLHGAFPGVADPNGLSTKGAYDIHQVNGKTSKVRANGKNHIKSAPVAMSCSVSTGYSELSTSKVGRPAKKRKVDVGATSGNGNEAVAQKIASEVGTVSGNGNVKSISKLSSPSDIPTKRCSAAPAFDARKLLIDKARAVIREKLEEMRLASMAGSAVAAAAASAAATTAASAAATTAAEKNEKGHAEIGKRNERPTWACVGGSDNQSELKKIGSMSITVPDSDFHDFDKDRAEECFKPKQIWALYDEEDGMPRLYCLIHEVISVKPFKIHISYLNSKTDGEFGSVKWIDSGFTKSCGNFRAWNSEIIDQVNVFSHLLSKEKAGRGGCVRIYPKSGDIWAIYRNWSRNWNRSTPDEVRHQYEMVEVLDDYSEELGVCVIPLVKLQGFKTVYQRNKSKAAIRWIPRREMVRFSHQVPSWLLKGESYNLPDGCWDLDPAATPDELLKVPTEEKAEEKPRQTN